MTDRSHVAANASSWTGGARPRRSGGGWIAGLQRSAGNRAVQRLLSGVPEALAGEEVSARIGAAASSGRELDPATRARVAEAIGSDPGPVRVHDHAEADDLAQTLGAKAFTSGRDVFFRNGAFDPSSSEGFGLLVHESTHVLQQAAGPVAGSATADGALAISDPGDAFELAASSAAAVSSDAPSPDSRAVQRSASRVPGQLLPREAER